jgi:hypothetical protein
MAAGIPDIHMVAVPLLKFTDEKHCSWIALYVRSIEQMFSIFPGHYSPITTKLYKQ